MLPNLDLPDSVQAVALGIAFFLPGFIAGKVFELCFPRTQRLERVRLLEYVTLSCLNYAVWSWLILLVIWSQFWETRPVLFLLYVLLVLLVSPLFLGVGMAVATEKQWFSSLAARLGIAAPQHLGTAWEWFFRTHRHSRWWLVIRLRSGKIAYGFFGWNSYMGSDRDQRDLYLEAECKVDEKGKFRVIKHTGGLYIRYDDVEGIGFRLVKETEKSDKPSEGRNHGT